MNRFLIVILNLLFLTGCQAIFEGDPDFPGTYSPYNLDAPDTATCLYLAKPYVAKEGIGGITTYTFPAGYYRPEAIDHLDNIRGVFYKAPTSVAMSSFLSEHLDGGIYIRQSKAYFYNYFRDKPIVNAKLPSDFSAAPQFKTCR